LGSDLPGGGAAAAILDPLVALFAGWGEVGGIGLLIVGA
jgi:hypothetical protein